MDFAITLLSFAFGILAGVAIMLVRSRHFSDQTKDRQLLSACQQENAQLRQNWQDHLAEYRSLATNLNEMARHIDNQVSEAEQLITPVEVKPAFPFFSSEATSILRATKDKKRIKSQLDSQPLDYSGSATGLFTGKAKDKTNAKH